MPKWRTRADDAWRPYFTARNDATLEFAPQDGGETTISLEARDDVLRATPPVIAPGLGELALTERSQASGEYDVCRTVALKHAPQTAVTLIIGFNCR